MVSSANWILRSQRLKNRLRKKLKKHKKAKEEWSTPPSPADEEYKVGIGNWWNGVKQGTKDLDIPVYVKSYSGKVFSGQLVL